MLTLLQGSEIALVSLEEAKNHLRLDHSYDDEYLLSLIQTATDYVENYLKKSVMAKLWKLVGTPEIRADGLSYLKLPNFPILEIISVKRIHRESSQVIKRYCLEQKKAQPEICIYGDGSPIEVVYRAGYGNQPKHIPPSVFQSVLIIAAEMYENRTILPMENNNLVQALLAPYRVMGVA
jgi:uncharacterized phiE125 gp8 family phage protein